MKPNSGRYTSAYVSAILRLWFWRLLGICALTVQCLGGESAYSVLHSFGATSRGKVPFTTLIEGIDGRIYGAAQAGGLLGFGALYRLNKDGSGLVDIYNFPKGTEAYLLSGSDGKLYVTTTSDGTNGFGTVFRINPDGTGFEVLHRFGEIAGDGKNPSAPLIEADGLLWGTTAKGGSGFGGGTVFKLDLDGSDYQVVRRFNYYTTEAWEPMGPVLDGHDGWLYGTARSGGTNYAWGSLYRILKDGSVLETIHSFTSTAGTGGHMPQGALIEDGNYLIGVGGDAVFRFNRTGTYFQFFTIFGNTSGRGYSPQGGLVRGADGAFYGTTLYGGNYGNGTLYRFNLGSPLVTWVVSFGSQERNPVAELLAASDGYLYGTTSENYLGGPNRIFRFDPFGPAKVTVAEFGASFSCEPYGPRAGVVETSDGTLLGLTTSGGITNAGDFFSLNPTNREHQSLRQFATSGGAPSLSYGPLKLSADGYAYGTSLGGGSAANGTVFKLDPSGASLQILWQFTSPNTEGRIVFAGVIEGPDAYLFGTASSGGTSNNGTVFRLSKYGTDFAVLHHFGVSGQDGKRPRAGLLDGGDGWLYGTSELGGAASTGTVYRVQADGGNYQTLRHFGGAPDDGARPFADLIRAANGMLYGTCREGGAYGDGTVFRLASDGTAYRVLHHFRNANKEGRLPQSRLIPAGADGLYGVTSAGGLATANGTLFRLGLDGESFTVLHHFGSQTADGLEPNGLTLAQDGALVGATRLGGVWNRGTIFRVLPLFIEPLQARIVSCSLAGSRMQLKVQGRPQTSYRVEATSNLWSGQWHTIAPQTQTSVLGTADFEDPDVRGPRFYRAVTP